MDRTDPPAVASGAGGDTAVTVPADLCINDCLRLMRMAGVRTAPVIENGELVGVLTFTDVLNSLRSPTG